MPILHIVAITRAVVNGTRIQPTGMKRFTTSAIERDMTCPYRAFRGWDAGAGVRPYCSVTVVERSR